MSSYNFSQRFIKRISNNIFYETIDFTPKYIKKTPIIAKPCNLVKNIKKNNIPFRERYETIDF